MVVCVLCSKALGTSSHQVPKEIYGSYVKFSRVCSEQCFDVYMEQNGFYAQGYSG